MRIQIIGYSGSGKSTLARALGELYGIPVLHLDNTKFYGDWQEYSFEEQNAAVEAFLADHDAWVIDGTYSRIAPRRFAESDMTIFLNFNRIFCFFSAWRRYLKYRGRARESCPCREKFDAEFCRWLLFEGRTRAKRQKLEQLLSKTEGERIVLKSRRAVNAFLKEQKAAVAAGGKQK
jgi:adenylate kinase family enzyme